MSAAVQQVGRHYRLLLGAVTAALVYSVICANVYIMFVALVITVLACLVLETTDFGSIEIPFYVHRRYLRRTRIIATISATAVVLVILGDMVGIW